MFAVKATYRSETRKFSFPDSSFPTYNQIHEQLIRVFPISSSYFLTRLLFTQSPNAPFARILIGMEARSEEEYEQHVRPFRGREWPDALLRFSVKDKDTPRDSQSKADEDILMDSPYSHEGRRRSRRHEHHHGRHHGHHRGHYHGERPEWPGPHSPFIAPPPPLLPPPPPPPLPPPPPPPPPPPSFPPFYGPPPPPPPPPHHRSPFTLPPPPFFYPHILPAPPLPDLPPFQPFSQSSPATADDGGDETPVQRLFRRRGLRSVASAPVLGPTVPVPPLPPRPRPVSQFGEAQVQEAHVMHQDVRKVYVSDELDDSHEEEVYTKADKEKQRGPCCDVESSKQEILELMRVFKADVDRVLSRSLGIEPADVWGVKEENSKPASSSSPIESDHAKASQAQPMEAEHPAECTPPPSPVIHTNIICDLCDETIIGVRHKCLDCPDFDLCASCLPLQPHNIGFHLRTHTFFAIEEAGGVWTHAVFTGEDTLESPERPANEGRTENSASIEPPTGPSPDHARALALGSWATWQVQPGLDYTPPPSEPTSHLAPEVPEQPHGLFGPRSPEQIALADNIVVHNATCDLCSSAIIGDRFKCCDCPDFDVCSSCYAIVPTQHPGHSFARLSDPTDLKLISTPLPVHRAGCNGCGKVIQGIRYKCMHPDCKDFDLCANCEALPIPVHPIAHAMLKIRQPGIYIPVVKRYGMEGGPIPSAVSAPSTHVSQEEDVRNGVTDPFAGLAIFQAQPAPTDSSTVQTPIPSNIPLPGAFPVPATVLMGAPHSESEPNSHGETAKRTASFSFAFTREGVDQSQSGRYSLPTTAPLLPVPSPPLALPTEFIRTIPSLHQNGQHITSSPEPDLRTEPWWGQSAWVPPTPFSVLHVPFGAPSTRSQSPDALVRFDESSASTLATAPTVRPKSDSGNSQTSLPHVPPTDFNELFDLASQFRHLLELPPVVTPPSLPVPTKETPTESEPDLTLTAVEDEGVPTELASTHADDTGTPLSLVALLSRPEKTPRPVASDSISPGRLLSQLLDSPSAASLTSPVDKKKNVEDAPLRASFIADNNIPDGQIFPPGAEFVKSWRMRNDGPGSWPDETELVFVAGDKLVIDKTERFKVGSVSPGEEVDVWTGEMKAPDIPGKYITYWRLSDHSGRRFGHSIWVDICVAEQCKAPTPDDGCSSLAASSIVMPNSAPSAPSLPIPSQDESTTAPLLSDASSISLIDVPSDNEDDEDNEVFEDSRSHFGTPANGQLLSPDVDYVVLSDGSDDI